MNLPELSAMIDAAEHVRRLETLPVYTVASDVDWVQRYLDGSAPPDPSAKRPWLDRLRSAADRGCPRERLRVIPDPVPGYVRYACEWGYVDNAAAGEIIRVIDAATDHVLARDAEQISDVYVLDGQSVVMHYDGSGRFQGAQPQLEGDRIARDVAALWARGVEFSTWWTMRTDLHRDAFT